VPDGAFGAEGRNVRCKACGYEWLGVADDFPGGPAQPGAADETEGDAALGGLAARDGTSPEERAPVDIESAARRREQRAAREHRARRIRRRIMAVAASLALLVGSTYFFRHTIVGIVPAAAGLYEAAGIPINVFGLDFANVRVAREFENGLPVLTVAGDIVNVSGGLLPVPRVRFGLRDRRQREIYHWTVAVSDEPLPPEGRARFATKLAAPPTEAEDVLLRFSDLPGRRKRQASLVRF
jgi:hypothetical protein